AGAIRDRCREFLEGKLRLTLNMDKTHITHVNEGFIFLGHRIIRKRGPKGTMRVVTGIPHVKVKTFAHSLSSALSGDYSTSKIDKVEQINQKLQGWSQFYRHTDYTAKIYSKIDQIVFWKLAYWLRRKYRCSTRTLLMNWYKQPEPGKTKTWVLFGKTDRGNLHGAILYRLVGSKKIPFRFRLPESNPYLRDEIRKTVTSRYSDVAMAVGHG
ncbi:MAG: group II intron maturase-specific domain-containing protein, partial [Legionella sp.]|uniref:group II intron maturase-specific domain-containing protein n=1 Tax=Legionella sp. TaxID=459 RepID=UPI00284B20B0|nr:group II intron maturase-specific domain-containing protein [Legionella sp.]